MLGKGEQHASANAPMRFGEVYLGHDCLNCGAYKVSYGGKCQECGRLHEVEREETEHGDFTTLL